jgi:hypothetical protein
MTISKADTMIISKADMQELASGGAGKARLTLMVQRETVTVLQRISGATELTIGERARALDNVIDIVGDDRKSGELINDHVLPAARAEILAIWGDRMSGLALVDTLETLIGGLERLCEVSDDTAAVASAVRGLASNINGRDDYEEFLNAEVGEQSIRSLLVASVLADSADGDEPLSADIWIGVGLDPEEAEALRWELPDNLLQAVTASSLFEARLEMARSRARVGLPESAEGSADDV